nr:retrovirus-related Pol polyprotein from transposon TNT 1-94 [Tanacetum cinerariifolium]
MFPMRSKDEDSEYPFFKGDGLSSDEWREYGMAGDDYEGPLVFDDDQYEEESMPVYDTNIEDVIEEEEGIVRKGEFGGGRIQHRRHCSCG